ncbi:MAG: hypothetical protein ABWY19_08990 [Marmoricola sp.]|jgi:hypothetical protein
MRTPVLLAALALSLGTLTACGGGDDEYCEQLKADQAYFKNFSSSSPDFDKLDEALDRFHTLADTAPDEVADDWKVIDDAFAKVEKALKDAGVKFSDLPKMQQGQIPEGVDAGKLAALGPKLQQLSAAKFAKAGKAIEKHAKESCDITLGLG